MTSDDLEDRLDRLEDHFQIDKTSVVIVAPPGAKDVDWPDGVDRADITHTRQHPTPDGQDPIETEVPVVPKHLPQAFRGGVVTMSYPEIAHVYVSMPDEVREEELERRLENGEPIPPILQQ